MARYIKKNNNGTGRVIAIEPHPKISAPGYKKNFSKLIG